MSTSFDSSIKKKLEILFYIDLYNDFIKQYEKDIISEEVKTKQALDALTKLIYIDNQRKGEKLLNNFSKDMKLNINKNVPDIIAELLKLIKNQ